MKYKSSEDFKKIDPESYSFLLKNHPQVLKNLFPEETIANPIEDRLITLMDDKDIKSYVRGFLRNDKEDIEFLVSANPRVKRKALEFNRIIQNDLWSGKIDLAQNKDLFYKIRNDCSNLLLNTNHWIKGNYQLYNIDKKAKDILSIRMNSSLTQNLTYTKSAHSLDQNIDLSYKDSDRMSWIADMVMDIISSKKNELSKCPSFENFQDLIKSYFVEHDVYLHEDDLRFFTTPISFILEMMNFEHRGFSFHRGRHVNRRDYYSFFEDIFIDYMLDVFKSSGMSFGKIVLKYQSLIDKCDKTEIVENFRIITAMDLYTNYLTKNEYIDFRYTPDDTNTHKTLDDKNLDKIIKFCEDNPEFEDLKMFTSVYSLFEGKIHTKPQLRRKHTFQDREIYQPKVRNNFL